MTLPTITAIVPVRNGMPYLREAIASLLAEAYPRLEIVVVDDGSTDNSRAFAEATGVCRVIDARETGPAAARNTGLHASASELVYFLDADDLPGPYTLRAAVAALECVPSAGFVQGCIQNFTRRDDGAIHAFTRPYRFINLGSAVWRRSVFAQVGGFDETLRLGEDQDLFMRCWEQDVTRVQVDGVMLYYRRHAGNMTRGLSGAGFGQVRIYKNRIDRIARGEYDPNTPRHVSWADYLGESPRLGECPGVGDLNG
jgi:glycosyltransferase involved in cell wall biosynthesis